jgi:predicted dehydrogenase
VLIIATTADLHFALTKQAIKRGFKRILIEKPVTQSHAQAVQLALLAKAFGVRLIINHGRRYDENYTRLLAQGDLRSIALRFGGGGLGCVGTHWIDLCNRLFKASPLSVNAQLTPAQNNVRGAKFNDAGGSLHLLYPDNRRAFIEIGDDIGYIGGAVFSFEKFQIAWQREDEPWLISSRAKEDIDKPNALYGLPLTKTPLAITPPCAVAYAKAALADALADTPPQSSITHAMETMAVFTAAHLSHARNKRIHLPLTPQQSRVRFPIP